MPGVPPDALNQVKKGLRGIFSRKKKDKTQAAHQPGQSSAPAAGSSSHAGTAMTSGAAAGAATTATQAPPTTTTSSTTPQLSTPANVAESQNIDLNPSAPSASTPAAPSAAPAPKEKAAPATLDTKRPAEGMSATSGPLSDDLGAGYGSAMSSPVDTSHAATQSAQPGHAPVHVAQASDNPQVTHDDSAGVKDVAMAEEGKAGTAEAAKAQGAADVAEESESKALPSAPTS